MKARLKKAKGPNTHSTWWCYIVAVLLILIYLLPIYIMLNLSFRTIQDVGSKLSLPAMWNFQNYIDVFKSGDLWLGFKNSIVLVVETVVVEIVFSALAAYGLARSNGKIAESIRNVNMGIMMIPGVALLVGTYGLMVKFHMTNTLYGLALLSAAGGIPGTMFMYVNFVVSIPVALDEAAAIDGAGIWQRIIHIMIPAIKKLAGTLLILQIISVFQIMYEPMVLTKGGPDNASLSLMQLMWQYAFGGSMNYGKASAVAVIVTLILLVMTAIYSYFDRKESDWD